MPGHMLRYDCRCGFHGQVNVGVSGTSPWNPESKEYVAAFDPGSNCIISAERSDAEHQRLFVFPDPYVYNPFRWILDGDESSAPPGEDARFMCPACRKGTLHFLLLGHWD